ncbi:MAG: MBL fold metallo-hydrolase [Polaromonas sp.]|nr:MBL fold metallo-hydrolase [Polaromonas sp.]
MLTPPLPEGIQVFERGWLSANNILFTGADTATLIDSGYCTHAAQTLALVDTALQGRQLNRLINTHLHSDHCGGNAALQAHYPELQTLIPPGHAQQVAQWDPVALTYVPTGQLCPRYRFDGTLQPGTTIRLGSDDWQVHAATGHDPHSVIFFEPRTATLLSADALWENGFGVVFPELEGEDAFDDVAITLDLIEDLRPRVVIPGHGRVFQYSGEILERARSRLDAFIANPARHANHAAKVLMKYKLLEVQQQPLVDFVTWAAETPYFDIIHQQFEKSIVKQVWLDQLVNDLVKAGVAKVEGALIFNQ